MRRETILKNIKHCDHYITTSNNPDHVEYYRSKKVELLKKLPEDSIPKQVVKFKSLQSPKKVALKYIDRIGAKQISQKEVAYRERVNEGSLSKAVYRIRKESNYAESRSFKEDYL